MSPALSLPRLPTWHCLLGAVFIGLLLRHVLGLAPIWWLAWIAPAPLLALAYRCSASQARWSVVLAALIGCSANLPYFSVVMPWPIAILVLLLQAALWLVIIIGARRVVLHYRAWWTVFAYPLFWAAADTLMGNFLPDGNWGGLGYTQADFLPALQLTALAGTPGLVFMLSLAASAVALLLTRGLGVPSVRACAVSGLLVAAGLGFGALRLGAALAPAGHVVFGLAAIDDFIGPRMPPALTEAVWHQYEQHVMALAHQGAQVIVLPEKIAVLPPQQAALVQQRFATLARQLGVSIVLGIGIDDGIDKAGQRRNLAWLLTPGGTVQSYQKQHMAPPEREFLAGSKFELGTLGAVRLGLAICKDMHFATFGRAYGARGAQVMLVPAWDFGTDAALASAITLTRGVENGYSIVRASREGWLTVTDPLGRLLAQRNSAPLPGTTLLVRAAVTQGAVTPYQRVGDFFGWLCTGLALSLAFALRKSSRRS